MSSNSSKHDGSHDGRPLDPRIEDNYWKWRHRSLDYIPADLPFELYRAAYRFGWESYFAFGAHDGRPFEHFEDELAARWPLHRGESALQWADARLAARDAWSHAESQIAPPPP